MGKHFKNYKLPGAIKQKALDSCREINIREGWNEFLLQEFMDCAETLGLDIESKDISHTGFEGQGQGSCINCKVNLVQLIEGITEAKSRFYVQRKDFKLTSPKIDIRVLNLLLSEEISYKLLIKPTGNRNHIDIIMDDNMPLNDKNYDNIKSELRKLEAWIRDTIESLNEFLFKLLKEEYDRLTIDEKGDDKL